MFLRHRTRPAKSSALQLHGPAHQQLDCPAATGGTTTACPYRYVLVDRDAKFGSEVHAFLESSGVTPKRTTVRSPWQNGTAERWVGSVRRELLDHVIPLNETHLRRLGREYIAYCHEDRTHLGLQKNTPAGRTIETRSISTTKLLSQPASVVFTIAKPGHKQPNRAGKSHPNSTATVRIRSTPASVQIAG